MSRVARASLIVAVFFGLDKVLGLLRQVITARQFGLTYEIDVFNAANNIPDLLSALISGGALGVALIPILSEYMTQRGRASVWDLFSRIINLAFLVTAGMSLGIAALAEPLVHNVIAPGFPLAQQALTTQVMRLDLIAILIFSISGLVMAGLNANQHFLLPAMAPAMYNLGQIFGLVILAPQEGLTLGPITLPAFGMGIFGLVYGVILGAVLHLAIQIPGLLYYKFHWTPAINLHHPGVQKVLWLMGPRLITVFFLQISFIVRDNLASGLQEGAVTALNYGWFIMQVPETLIGTALGIALLPTLSEEFAGERSDVFRDTVNRAIRVLLALTLPVAAVIWVVIPPLVQTAFHFNASETQMVVVATRAFLLGLTGQCLLEVAARSFYARQDARTPLWVSALNAVAIVVFSVVLTNLLGQAGIALANSLVFTGEALLLLYILNRRLPGLLRVGSTLPRVALTTLGVAVLAYVILQLPLPELLLAVLAAAVGAVVALPFIWPEVKILVRL